MQNLLTRFLALALGSLLISSSNKPNQGLVALYHLDEGAGNRIFDSSGKNNHGTIVGSAIRVDGIRGKALLFDGLSRVRIPSSPQLDLKDQVSVAAWVKGEGSKYRLSQERSSRGGPYFQVVGDQVYFAYNSCEFSSEQRAALQRAVDSKGKEQANWQLLTNIYNLWTGTADINLTKWEEKRGEALSNMFEPKLQVVGDKIYYEYFGQDKNKAWQIWTAQSNIDGSGWHTVQRTDQREGWRVEQDFNIQVAQDKIYYGYPQKDENNESQLWTASSNLDGSDFKTVQRTTEGGWIPYLQVVGGKVYYAYATFNESGPPQKKNQRNKLFLAESGIDGTEWKVIKTIEDLGYWYGFFQITNNKIYLIYSQLDKNNVPHLFTARMDLDGSNFQAIQRTFENQTGEPSACGIQVVGNRVYYSFQTIEIDKRGINVMSRIGERGATLWTGQANLDGSNWKSIQRTTAPPDAYGSYKSVLVVGGKTYGSVFLGYPKSDLRCRMATSGSNIINKGDAYGIGLSEDHEARGFINAGQDYLFRAEAPSETAGAIADYLIDNNWHYLVMTFDRKTLRLYVDGQLKTTTPYSAEIGSNPFPVIIGDGFQGIMDEIAIYNRVLRPEEISNTYRQR